MGLQGNRNKQFNPMALTKYDSLLLNTHQQDRSPIPNSSHSLLSAALVNESRRSTQNVHLDYRCSVGPVFD